jgi:hypothetical protein
MVFLPTPAARLLVSLCLIALIGAIINRKDNKAAILIITVLGVIIKLYLVGRNEIITEPNDQTNYVIAATQWWRINSVSPGYPIWLWLTGLIGAPQRMAIEALLAFSAAVVALACGKKVFSYWGYAMVFLSIVFSPLTYALFDRALSDGFYLCLCLCCIGFGSLCFLLKRRRARIAALSLLGLTIGWMQITRKETPFILAILLIWAVVSVLWLRRDRLSSLSNVVGKMIKELAYVGAIALLVVNGMLFTHYRYDGVWGMSIMEMPEYVRLLKNLSSIRVEEHKKYVPITKIALNLAYSNSPEFKKLQPFLDDPKMVFHTASEGSYGMTGELASGWMWLAPLLAGNIVKWTPKNLEAYYRSVNRELNKSFHEGTLKKQFVTHALIGGAPGLALSALPSEITTALRMSWLPDIRPTEWKDKIDNFNTILFRRVNLILSRNIDGPIVGWAFSSKDKIKNVYFEEINNSDSTRASAIYILSPQNRPDVTDAFQKQNKKAPIDCGFNSSIFFAEGTKTQVRFTLENGLSAIIAGDMVHAGVVSTIRTLRGDVGITYAFDTWPTLALQRVKSNRIGAQDRLMTLYERPIVRFFAYILAACGLVVGLAYRERNERAFGLFIILVFLLGFSFLRIGFYGTLGAVGFPVLRRYVSVASMSAFIAGMLGLLSLVSMWRMRRKYH